MMKIGKMLSGCLLLGLVAIGWLHMPVAQNHQLHHGAEGVESGEGPVTLSIRQNDFALCDDPFWVGLYQLTREVFADGARQVVLSQYQERVFGYIRAQEGLSAEQAEAFVDHVKDIPRQLIEIIDEDGAVLDSCANFSVALVGPP